MQVQHDSFNSRLGFHSRGSRIQLKTKQKTSTNRRWSSHSWCNNIYWFFSFAPWGEGRGKKGTYSVLTVAPQGVHRCQDTNSKASPLIRLQQTHTSGRVVDLTRLQFQQAWQTHLFKQCHTHFGERHNSFRARNKARMDVWDYVNIYFISFWPVGITSTEDFTSPHIWKNSHDFLMNVKSENLFLYRLSYTKY